MVVDQQVVRARTVGDIARRCASYPVLEEGLNCRAEPLVLRDDAALLPLVLVCPLTRGLLPGPALDSWFRGCRDVTCPNASASPQ